MDDRRYAQSGTLETELQALRDKLVLYQRSPAFGCYTRQALELDVLPSLDPVGLAIIYFDIDGLTKLNADYGKAARIRPDVLCVNERISTAFAQLRASDVVIGQWFSGDEFIALLPHYDAYGFAARLQGALHAVDMSATISICDVTPDDTFVRAIDRADAITAQSKARNARNSIADYRSKA